MLKITDIRVGSVVRLRPAFGTGNPIEVKVSNVDDDIKNGRPGIDYNGSWAYLSQVDEVITF